MRQAVVWFREQKKDRRFRKLLCFTCILAIVLAVEFHLLSYSLLKSIRYLVLFAALFVIAWIDQHERRIPNKILFVLLELRAILLLLEWSLISGFGLPLLISVLTGALLGGGMFLLAYVISKGGVGMGDVKLFVVVGCYMGSRSIMAVIFLTVTVSAVYSILLLLLKKVNLKEEIPFAPFIWIGTILTMAFGM